MLSMNLSFRFNYQIPPTVVHWDTLASAPGNLDTVDQQSTLGNHCRSKHSTTNVSGHPSNTETICPFVRRRERGSQTVWKSIHCVKVCERVRATVHSEASLWGTSTSHLHSLACYQLNVLCTWAHGGLPVTHHRKTSSQITFVYRGSFSEHLGHGHCRAVTHCSHQNATLTDTYNLLGNLLHVQMVIFPHSACDSSILSLH